jgi:hypothetical protein
MTRFLPAITLLIVLASCSSSKDYLAHRNEDKTLYSIIKQLNKKPGDELATAALPEVYAQLQQTHVSNINNYKNSTELNRWDRINSEYQILQEMYNAIINSSAASNLVTAVSYQKQIDSTKQAAADGYYQLAMQHYYENNWMDARKAYAAFKKADSWISNYNGSRLLMDSAKDRSIVTVVINPVQDNSFFYNSGWSNNSFDVNSANFPQNLMTDLGGKNGGRYPARFYTDWLAQRDNINADWVVDLIVKNVHLPSPTVYNYTRKLSAKVEDGRDTSGKVMYKTVYATLHIQRRSFNATAQMDMRVTDGASEKNILYDTFTDSYNWQQEAATYSGDSRALGNRDWELVNNRYYQPAQQEVINELYRGLYPQVKNRIIRAVDF